jgi:hypothetical protein
VAFDLPGFPGFVLLVLNSSPGFPRLVRLLPNCLLLLPLRWFQPALRLHWLHRPASWPLRLSPWQIALLAMPDQPSRRSDFAGPALSRGHRTLRNPIPNPREVSERYRILLVSSLFTSFSVQTYPSRPDGKVYTPGGCCGAGFSTAPLTGSTTIPFSSKSIFKRLFASSASPASLKGPAMTR